MKKEFDLDGVLGMKRPEYKKLFKKMAIWKKAKGVIILIDYKFDGKKTSLAIPYKKKPMMLKELKKIKADKIHLMKKTGLCSFELSKKEDGKALAKMTIIKGGLSAELLKSKMRPVFGAIDVDIEVVGLEGAAQHPTSDASATTDSKQAKKDNSDSLVKSTNQSFLYLKDFVLPGFKAGTLDTEDLIELDTHETNFKQFLELFDTLGDAPALPKLKEAIEKLQPQIAKIRSALDGSNPELQGDLMHNKLKNLAKSVEKKTKKIKKTVVKNLKKKQTGPRDVEVLDDVLEMMNEFEFNFDAAAEAIRAKVQKLADKLLGKLKPQLNDLHLKVAASTPDKQSEIAENERIKLRYAEIDDRVKDMKIRIEQLLKEVEDAEKNAPQPEPLPEGEDFVNSIS